MDLKEKIELGAKVVVISIMEENQMNILMAMLTIGVAEKLRELNYIVDTIKEFCNINDCTEALDIIAEEAGKNNLLSKGIDTRAREILKPLFDFLNKEMEGDK